MLQNWDSAINANIWQNVDVQFRIKDITLKKFNNGDDFYNSVIEYIDNQIKNVEQKNEEERLKLYNTFADSVYNTNIAGTWLPLLERYNMLSDEQIDGIDEKIDEWHNSLGEPMPNWIYILVIAVLVLVVVLLVIMVFSKNKKINKIQNT